MKNVNIAVVGATGFVGSKFLKLIENDRNYRYNIKLFASEKSLGKEVIVNGKMHKINLVDKNSFKNCDFVFLFTNSTLSKRYAPLALKSGAIVIDNSSNFRMKKNVPLIVPEINFSCCANKKLIANPNCSTLIALLPIFALKKYGLREINFTTFQSVSGSGIKGLNALIDNSRGIYNDFYGCDITKTCLPQIGNFLKNGNSEEEQKMINETHKIFNDYFLKISATCVRVPVPFCHAVSVLIKFSKNFTLKGIKNCLKKQSGIIICDNFQKNIYPTSLLAVDKNEVFVGRLRRVKNVENTLLFYVVGDNLLRGAAYNAYLIMQEKLKINDSL